MTKLDAIINEYVKKLRGTKSLEDVRKAVEKDLYKKLGVSRRVESLAYAIADYVADRLNIRQDMYLECTCADIGIDKWNELMRGARKCSYKRLVKKVKKELPMLYNELSLELYNPYENDCRQTKTHYILVSSAIEYFIRK